MNVTDLVDSLPDEALSAIESAIASRRHRERQDANAPVPIGAGDFASLDEVEKAHIGEIVRFTKGNRREAARILRISELTLYRKLKAMESIQ